MIVLSAKNINTNVCEFRADMANDLQYLPTTTDYGTGNLKTVAPCASGSVCIVTNTGDVYYLDGDKNEWTIFAPNSGKEISATETVLWEKENWKDSTAGSPFVLNQSYYNFDWLYILARNYSTGAITTSIVDVADLPVFESNTINGSDYQILIGATTIGIRPISKTSFEQRPTYNSTMWRINKIVGIKVVTT